MKTTREYLESPEVKGLAKSTRELYGYALNHMQNFLGDKKGIDKLDMPGFATYLEKMSLSGKSIQQYLTCTKIFLKWAGHPVQFTYKVSNKDRQSNKKKHLHRWFSEQDIEKCLGYKFENSNGDSLTLQAIVRILVETGVRVGEVSSIKAEDIFLEDQYIFVHGKTEPRPVIISEETVEMLEQVLGGRIPFSSTMRIFPQVAKIKSAITRMLNDLGLKSPGDGRGPHTFRHHTATYLFYTCGMRIEDLAFLLGDKVETIREKYLHPTPEMIKKRVLVAWGKWEE